MADDLRQSSLTDTLKQAVGADNVALDAATLRLMSEDIWSQGALAAAVVAPANAQELAHVVSAANAAGAALLPRGGGMSYTGGYIHDKPGAIVLDLRRMNRVLEINDKDMIARVEAGCTWQSLYEAAKAKGLRTPFWGPLSGISSTIGGGLSQNNAFFGAGQYGTTGESVTSLTIVLADGAIIRTGTAGKDNAPAHYRFYGPDMTGLFLGDCGAFGVKAEAAFRLMRMPEHEGWLSFSFDAAGPCAEAMAEVSRAGLACELFGFDPNLARIRMKRASMIADAGTLMKVVGAQKSLFEGLKEGAKMALAGRGFLDGADYSLHAVAEGRSKAAVDSDLAAIRKIVLGFGAKEVENTIPKVIRANPFTPLNNILGPGGERWAPVHGIVAHSKAASTIAAIEALFASMNAEFETHHIVTGALITTMSTNGFLIEPVFFWPEERYSIHDATVEPSFLAKLPRLDKNPAASDAVKRARAGVIKIFADAGAAHFQVARAYPLLETRTPETRAFYENMKRALDPNGIMNPGALGLA
jgi:FAD/FMN-containing dehydrogenase